MVAGTYPGMIISAAQRQAAWLHKISARRRRGYAGVGRARQRISAAAFFTQGQCRDGAAQFHAARLVLIIDQLAAAALEMRKQAALAAVIAQRALLSIAVNAKRRG